MTLAYAKSSLRIYHNLEDGEIQEVINAAESDLATAGVTVTEDEEDPDEGTFRAALVIATNEEQITVHVDANGTCWVYDEIKGWKKG